MNHLTSKMFCKDYKTWGLNNNPDKNVISISNGYPKLRKTLKILDLISN